MPDNDIVLNAVVEIDEARSVRSIDSLMRQVEPKIQKAFTLNPKQILSDYKKAWEDISKSIRQGVNKPLTPKISAESLMPLRKQVEMSYKTRMKLGMSSDLKVFSTLKEVQGEIARIENLKSSDFTLEKYDHSMIQQELDYLKKRETSFISAESKIKKALETNLTEREKATAKLQEEIKKLDELKAKYISLKTELDKKVESGESVSGKEKGQVTRQLSKINAQDKLVREAQANLDKLTNTKKLTKFGKFWNRFNSYLNVRLLRNFFSAIEKGFSESLKSITQVDSGINKSMSQITSSFQMISASLVSMVGPILETLAPIIQQISVAIANVANGFNQASAKAKGLSEYTKINTEYMKDFAEESNSATLSFDKFESLSGGDPLSGMFEKGDTDEELLGETAELGAELYKTLTLVLDVLKQIWEVLSPILGALFSLVTPILEFVSVLLTVLSPAIESVVTIVVGVINQFKGAFDIISGLLYLLTGDFDKAWEHIGSGFKSMLQGIFELLIGAVNLFLDSINFLFVDTNPLFWILKGIGVPVKNFRLQHFEAPKLFANGGIAEQGDLFIANEAGPELVYSGPNNSSSIMNIAQFRQAVVEGLYEWWSDAKYDLPEPSTSSFDGASVARSRSFIDEFNRRNTSIKIR